MVSTGPTGVAPVLQVHPSRRCNLACAHCYTSSGPQMREALALETLTACIEQAAALGYRQLAVSGGEPLLYPDLAALLMRARQAGMLTSITTNGMLATHARWEPLARLIDVVAISIDGTPDEHDAIRRHDGAFARTVANLEVIRRSRVPFGLLFTLTQHNVDSLEFVVRLAADCGARSVQVHPLTLHGRAIEMLSDARPDGLELIAAIIEAEHLGEQLGVVVHVDALDSSQVTAFHDRLVPARPVARLVDVAPVLVVQANGQVIPMSHEISPAFWLGSLHEAPLDILAEHWLAGAMPNELADACEATWHVLAGARSPASYWYDAVAAQTYG